MRTLLAEQGIPTVLTAAADDQPEVAWMLERLGAQRVPATFYAWTPQIRGVQKES
jgi:hypothetical protein